MSSILDREKPGYERMGLGYNPFGAPVVELKDPNPTVDQMKKAIPLIYVKVYGYTHTHPKGSRDGYYCSDWRGFDKAIKRLAEVLQARVPICEGYCREYGRLQAMKVDGKEIDQKTCHEIDDWESMKSFLVGFATALRTIPIPHDFPGVDEEVMVKAFKEMLNALDILYISVQWQ